MEGYEIAIGALVVGMIFLIVRNIRKDKSDGRGVTGGRRDPGVNVKKK